MTDRSERPPLSPIDLAERWGCSTTLIYDLLAAGTLRGFKLGKLWRIPVAAVEEYESGSPAPVDALESKDTGEAGQRSNDTTDAATKARIARLEG
ncbi:helix-turn-helix domain-containing protein [Alteriqipengyuania sp.]